MCQQTIQPAYNFNVFLAVAFETVRCVCGRYMHPYIYITT